MTNFAPFHAASIWSTDCTSMRPADEDDFWAQAWGQFELRSRRSAFADRQALSHGMKISRGSSNAVNRIVLPVHCQLPSQ